jgi:Zn-dependent M32 family carboxypeptidase
MGSSFDALVHHLRTVEHLNAAEALLGWDQQVLMPPGGAESRASVLETISRISHELFTGDQTARLLDAAEREIDGAPYDSDEASLIRVVREDYRRLTKLPAELVAENARATALAHEVWANARARNDFAAFVPALTENFEIARRIADHLGYDDHPYDALLGEYERGMTSAQVKAIFDDHKTPLVARSRRSRMRHPSTMPCCTSNFPSTFSARSRSMWSKRSASIFSVDGRILRCIRSRRVSAVMMSASPPAFTRTSSTRRCSA